MKTDETGAFLCGSFFLTTRSPSHQKQPRTACFRKDLEFNHHATLFLLEARNLVAAGRSARIHKRIHPKNITSTSPGSDPQPTITSVLCRSPGIQELHSGVGLAVAAAPCLVPPCKGGSDVGRRCNQTRSLALRGNAPFRVDLCKPTKSTQETKFHRNVLRFCLIPRTRIKTGQTEQHGRPGVIDQAWGASTNRDSLGVRAS